jgi:hypothetical protein
VRDAPLVVAEVIATASYVAKCSAIRKAARNQKISPHQL